MLRSVSIASIFLLAACSSDPTSDVSGDGGPTDAGAAPDTGLLQDAGQPQDAGPLAPATVTMVSLNLRCLMDDWPARRQIIARGLADLAPDVIGIQEACSADSADNVADLSADLLRLTGRQYRIERHVTHRAWDQFDEGIALLSALPMEQVLQVDLPGGAFTRALLLARIRTANGTFVLGTTHLDNEQAGTRRAQAQRVVHEAGNFKSPPEAIVISGDYNSDPFGQVKPVFVDAGYLDLWYELRGNAPGLTFPANAPTWRIDYFWMAPGGAQVSATHIERILTQPENGITASDHIGLYGVITLDN